MTYTDITAQQLIEMTRVKSDYILIDCRSFLIYNKGHISGATNVRCNSIMKRRNKGALSLENAITNGRIREEFLTGNISTVVVYDDQGEKIEASENVKSNKTISMVIAALQKHAPLSTLITYLNGGYKEFSARFPEKCTGSTRTTLPTMHVQNETSACIFTPIYDQGAPVEILPHLYLGSAHHASQKNQLETLGITSVLNASTTCPNYFEGDYTYKRIPVEDNNRTDISAWFSEAISFIDETKYSKGKVLVHCHAGISRSATLCLAYLITCHKVSLSDAFQYVKHRRNVISPNFNFMGQLLKLESEVAERDGHHAVSHFDDSSEAKENLHKIPRPRSHTDRILAPLQMNDENMDTTDLCLTAPPRVKEFSFFSDLQLSCSQESAEKHAHSIRTPTFTLST